MENFKIKDKYYPTLVTSINRRIDDDNVFFTRQKTLKSLPKKTQDLMYSDEIVTFIFGVEKRYKLQDEQTEEFSRSVRQYYFREITKELFIHKISQICRISENEASKLFIAINNIRVSDENESDIKTIKLPLNKAIKKYPQILKQQITTDRITTKPFLKPLVPNVKNWIMVYEKILGVSAHTMIERGEFVFRSDATKGMSAQDRKKLLMLFKSRDDNSNLVINESEGLIELEVVINTQKNNSGQKTDSGGSMHKNNETVHKQQIQKKSINAMNSGNVILRNPSSLGYIHTHSESMEKVVEEENIENVENIPEENVEIKNPQLRKIAQSTDSVLDKIEKKQIDQVNLVEKDHVNSTQSKDVKLHPQSIISNKVNKNDSKKENNQKTNKIKSALIPENQAQIENVNTKSKKQADNVNLLVPNKTKALSSNHSSKVMKEVQNEIVKNRVEMSDKKIDKKKIKNIGNERKQGEMGTPVIQKNSQNSDRTIIEAQQKTNNSNLSPQNNKKVVKKQGNIAGEISFSSNHTMPAEKKKPVSKQKKYNAFNMQPLGQNYRKNIEE